jgi:hypothetical protein
MGELSLPSSDFKGKENECQARGHASNVGYVFRDLIDKAR